MKTDVQIAQEAQMQHITEVASKVGLKPEDLELYGNHKAKIHLDVMVQRLTQLQLAKVKQLQTLDYLWVLIKLEKLLSQH